MFLASTRTTSLRRCSLLAAGLFCLGAWQPVLGVPVDSLYVDGRDEKVIEPKINADFPDPALIQGDDGLWYSFATNSNGNNIQVAKASQISGSWELLDNDALPQVGWATGSNTWAPDVRKLDNGSFIMYYSGEVRDGGGRHCIGVGISDVITGPYRPTREPWVCPFAEGGAIDAAGFYDEPTKKRYVLYKVDGNNVGNGGDCNNGVPPLVDTPIMLQEVEADGISKVGDPVQILGRTDADGPLVEAPNLVRTGEGLYILFFSSFCFNSDRYNVNYATSKSLKGPYTRASRMLLQTGDFNLTAPGGATSVDGGGQMVFHGNCPETSPQRCMYQTLYSVTGRDVIIS
ncbi:glycosyl hydrolase family 43 protein [Colletotrichum tofieldiae]|uniref:Glycosyl hydrolase family 43 protein n=1 Tax=Colletotrichum tofieldiae TaxID=708197 RepID=A0A161WK30_9PEZI|nr:glycosyl hydrolase family 43 protein [Colletotrichum tofieldiae]GKT58773.1 glycosyl hydrolase family 43 protein [Colletotrichum tofieldiae]GKT77802.1 glycosyl hydrolase family 43 protein [Colletotrichum tofieldiae]